MKKANHKKCIYILLIVILFLLIKGGTRWKNNFIFSSLNKCGEDSENINTASDGSSENDSNKDGLVDEEGRNARYKKLPIISNLQSKDTYYEYQNDKLAWWFVRDKNHGKSGCDDTIKLDEYDGYYVDLDTEEKVIYLTFDCGYENGYTEHILDVLKKTDVPACFFVTKTYIRDNKELTTRMKEEGHQVGNHTITHPSLPTKSFEEIVEEITKTADYMKEVTGFDMDPYLRPPRGEYSCRTLAITRDLGYKTIFWSIAYVDFDVNKQPGADYVIEHFNKFHHSGAIVLMHNVSSSNAEALETVINNLKNEGYRFASLNELK